MSSGLPERVRTMKRALEIFSGKVVVPSDADFNKLGAYVHPLMSQVPVVLEVCDANGRIVEERQLTRGKKNEIIRLHLENEWKLFEMLEAQHKGSFEHGGIERQLQACHHSDQRYRQNVLDRNWLLCLKALYLENHLDHS